MMSIMSGMALYSFQGSFNTSEQGAEMIAGFIRQVRAKGVAATSAYTIFANGYDQIVSSYSDKCSDALKTPDDTLVLDLPVALELTSSTWSVCFSSRGLADANILLEVFDTKEFEIKEIEVFLGGAIRVN